MASPVVHFEIGSTDSAGLAAFYSSVFGWSFAPLGAAQALVGGAEGGPTGMLNTLGHPPDNYVMVYIRTDDLEAALARVDEAGGSKIVGPVPLPDGRRFAWVRDTAGNVIGLLSGNVIGLLSDKG
jgi:predicted enzyme related to lactoylglutathione lyase